MMVEAKVQNKLEILDEMESTVMNILGNRTVTA
jgi:hypothetical protein